MQKFGLVLDSTTVLDPELFNKFDIEVVSLNVVIDGQTHRELDLTEADISAAFKVTKNLSTGSPSPYDFSVAYERLIEKGYHDIVVLPISSVLSSTFQSARMGIDLLEKEVNVHVIDAKSCNVGVTDLLETFWDEIEAGIAADVFVDKMLVRAQNSLLQFTVEDLKQLFRSGRLNRVALLAAELLRIKPVVQLIDGGLKLVGKYRTFAKISDLFTESISALAKGFKNLHITVVTLGDSRFTDAVANAFNQAFPHAKIKFITRVNPVYMVSIGERGIGFAATAYND